MEQLGRKSRQKVGSPEGGEPGDLGVSCGLGPREQAGAGPGVRPSSALMDNSAGGSPG